MKSNAWDNAKPTRSSHIFIGPEIVGDDAKSLGMKRE